MRKLMSTTLVVLIVGALAGIPAAAVAQSEPAQDEVSPSAVFANNADKVDGKHAIRATARLGLRAKKLVATDRTGFLPSNIVRPLWHLIQNKPPVLDDGQVSWSEIVNKPSLTVTRHSAYAQHDTLGAKYQDVSCPAGVAVGGGFYDLNGHASPPNLIKSSYPVSATTWRVEFDINSTPDVVHAYVVCLSGDPMPIAAHATPAAKNAKGDG